MAKSHHDKAKKAAEKARLREQQRQAAKAKNRLRTIKKTIIWGVSLIIIIAIIVTLVQNAKVSTEGLPELTLTEPSELDHIKGNPNSSVIIMEYSDFQCPACAGYYPVIKQFMEQYGDNVTFMYRHFPLRQIHPHAQMAAQAAEAASKQGKFYEMHDMLFENQAEWDTGSTKAKFVEYASEIGLDVEQFTADLESEDAERVVQHMFDDGVASGVQGTPTFFINGVRVQLSADIADFERRILPLLN